MRTLRLALACSVVLVLSPFVSVAHAQVSNISWVSGTGNDGVGTLCSRTAPCQTITGTNGALHKTQVGGEIVAIDAIDSGGQIMIQQSLTIDGTSGLVTVQANAAFDGVVVQAPSSAVVVLRNLVIIGIGAGLNGISILSAGDVRIENCKIYGFQQGIFDNRAGGHLSIKDTVISNNSSSGIIIDAGAASTLAVNLERVQMHSNGNAGFAITNGAHAVVSNSSSTSNTHGIYADSASVLDLNHSVVFGNVGTGINAQSGALVRLFDSLVSNNRFGLSNTAANIFSFGQNRIAGNITADGSPNMSLPVQ